MQRGELSVQWIDWMRKPRCEPNPQFPNGVDVILADHPEDEERTCFTDLPYPAKRCGVYIVTCKKCGLRVAITTAGRPDDPRSALVGCLERKH